MSDQGTICNHDWHKRHRQCTTKRMHGVTLDLIQHTQCCTDRRWVRLHVSIQPDAELARMTTQQYSKTGKTKLLKHLTMCDSLLRIESHSAKVTQFPNSVENHYSGTLARCNCYSIRWRWHHTVTNVESKQFTETLKSTEFPTLNKLLRQPSIKPNCDRLERTVSKQIDSTERPRPTEQIYKY